MGGHQVESLLPVSDRHLRGLDIDELLDELLDGAREILHADTAAALLLDTESNELVATSARGLEEEVYQGVRIPVGQGFAGRIASTRRPAIIDHVDDATVVNPILWEKGIRTLLGVPLLGSDGTVIGVIHVGRTQGPLFDDDDVSLLELVAERLSGAIQSNRLAAETRAAKTLERSLMPTALPKLPELRLSARCVAARRDVGGDWYDAFVLPSGTLWLIAGDVAGHGLSAAVVMGRVRSTLRAYALLENPPERTLALTDMKIHQFEIGTMVTVVCAVANPPYSEFRISSAGHPPPLLIRSEGDGSYIDLIGDLPLGVDQSRERHATTCHVGPGSVLLMYTDGLVERHDESIDVGLEKLRRSAAAADPEAVCRFVMHRMVGSGVPTDDVALLAARHVLPDEIENSDTKRFAPEAKTVALARDFAVDRLRAQSLDVEVLALVVTELAANAVTHAGSPYTVKVSPSTSGVRVEVADESENTPSLLIPSKREPHGRGLFLVDQLALAWGVATRAGGKTVWAELP